MSAKVALKKTVSNAIVSKKIHESSIQVLEERKNIKQCLKLLDSGELHSVDVEGLQDEFLMKPHLGDHIQYELHKYCLKDASKSNPDVVVKLAELCYSHISVSNFSNIDRFVGCVYYICNYLLKKEKYKSALDIIYSLIIKKNEIVKHSEKQSDIRTFLCNLHNSFIASAIVLASKIKSVEDEDYQISHNLAIESLQVFKLTNMEQIEVGKKVLKTSTLYFQTIKHYREADVLKFYKALNDILKILLPKMDTLDYLLYFLYKMNQLKKSDTEGEVHQALKRTVDFLMLFLDSSLPIRSSFNKILDFFWKKTQSELWIYNGDFKVLNEKHSHSKFYFLLVSSIFSYGIQFVWRKFEKKWNENVSVAFVQKLSKTIMEFHKAHFGNSVLYCSSAKGPFDACFGDLLTGNLQKIQYTVRLCLKNKVPDALSLVPISREAFKLSMECLELMSSKGCCKEQRIYSWKLSIIHHRNTVEDICRHSPSEETWLYLKDCSREILKEIVSSDVEPPFDFKSVNILFHRWHTASLKLKNYQDALFACVAYYAVYPQEEKEIASMWLLTKSESSNEIFEEITMSEIFKTCDRSLREFSKNHDGSNLSMKSVLLTELKAYGSCLPDTFQNSSTPYNLAIRIWKQLEKYNLDLWETSSGLSSLISVNIAGDNEKLPINVHKKCEKLIDELKAWKAKGKTQCRSLLHAANLTFSLFLYNVKTAEKSEGKTDTTQMVLGYLKKAEEEKVKFGEDVDLNLTCDVIPSSSHLTVELETSYLNGLNKIVDLWSDSLKNGFDEPPTETEYDLWLRNVKQVACLYELIGEHQRSFTTWLLFYKIGKLCNSPGGVLLGLTRLIENCTDVDESGIKEEAELIYGKLGSETSEKFTLGEYSLAIASNYLKNKKSEKCLEYLSLAKKVLEGLKTSIKTYTLNAKFWCLVSQFLTVYKEYEAVFDYPVGTDVRVMAFKAFSYANGGGRSDLIKSVTQSECAELILAMLEVNLWCYHVYGVYRQTDFMRFFLDDLYQIVQKLFLPTRTAEMLARLAEVDVICEKVLDCQGKVTKLKSILTTVSSRCTEAIQTKKTTSPYLSVPQKSEFEPPVTRPISPARFITKRPSSNDLDASPIHFYLNDVKSSKGAEHTKKCKCRLCQNLLIQTLTMNTITLEAEIHNMGNNAKQAAKSFSEASEVLDKLELLRAEQSKILRLELATVSKEVPGELDFKLASVQFQCARFYMRYALFEASSLKSVTENVTKNMHRVSKLMKRFSYEEKLLQWTFTELKLYCFVLNKGDAKPQKKSTPVLLKTTAVAKTPAVNPSAEMKAGVDENSGKIEKSPHPGAKARKILFEDDKSSDDPMNTGFVESSKLKTSKKIIRPRKLSFGTNEPGTNTKINSRTKPPKAAAIDRTMTTQTNAANETSQASLHSGLSFNFAKTLQVQDQIIEQLRADQAALKEALEVERTALRDCRLTSDRELKAAQREKLQIDKISKQQALKIEELEEELAYTKEALAIEQRNLKSLEKEHLATVKELKLKFSKNFEKNNKQEVIIDQLKSEIEDLKEALNSERNATNLLIREHNAEVKALREEVKNKSTEAYRELKERATREREEYREMQEEAEKTYKILERDFRESLAAKDEELRKVKAEAKLIQKELEDQLRVSLKETSPAPVPFVMATNDGVDVAKFKRLKNEVAILKEQNRRLLNELQVLTEARKPKELSAGENYIIPYNNLTPEKKPEEVKEKALVAVQEKPLDVEITRMPSDFSINKELAKRLTKSSLSLKRDDAFKPYPKTKTEERYEELKRTMMILRKALH